MKTQKILHIFFIAAILVAIIVLFSCDKEEAVEFASVVTLSVTDITETTASGGGNVAYDGGGEITARGVVWSSSTNPTIESNLGITSDGTGIGEYTSEITGLSEETTYFVRAYATNKAGTSYGNEVSFQTLKGVELATVTTIAVTDITHNSAKSGGNITNDGGDEITARGVVWSTSENPTLENNDGFTEDDTGAGEFVSEIAEIAGNTQYYVRAYATNSVGTAYGSQEVFATFAFYDDFSDNRNEWYTDDETFYLSNGYYHINYNNPGYFVDPWNTLNNFDFSGDFTMVMSFVVHSIYDDYSFTGLTWNAGYNPTVFRLLRIYHTGRVRLSDYHQDTGWTYIFDGDVFSGYSTNNEIEFALVKTGSNLDIYINQTRVYTIYSLPPDIAVTSWFGLPVYSMHIAFNWIKIYGEPNQKVDFNLKEKVIDLPAREHGFKQVLPIPER